MDRVATIAPFFAAWFALSSMFASPAPARVASVVQRASSAERYDWPATWRALDALRELPRGSDAFRARWKELGELAGGRERDSRTLHDRPAIFRARLLRAQLAVLADKPPPTVPDPTTAIEFGPGEAWMAAQHLASGPLRVRAFREAIAEARGATRDERWNRAVQAVDEDVRVARLTTAEALARFLYDISASPDSTAALSRVLRASGRDDEALSLLEAALDLRLEPAARAALALECGRVERNLGRDTASARWFGAALSEGSVDAALEVAHNALAGGDRASALTVFRALLDGDRPDRAWRGWGLTQLADGTAEASSRNSGNPQNLGN